MLFQHSDWDLTHQALFLYIYFAQPSYELERPALENAHTLVQRTDIFSCKFSVKVSLMLDNSFLVPSLCKLNHISLCFIQISTKSPAELLLPFRESTVFWGHPRCFGPLSKFQHNIKIFIKTAHVSRLSVSCDYDIIRISYYKADDSFVSNWSFYLLKSAFFIKGRCNFWKSSKKGWGTFIFSVTIGGWKRG